MIVVALKRTWHHDLASDPVAHAWALNLYRAGERHPQTVQDYFPVDAAPDPDLAALLHRHQLDEERHTRIYTALIQGLGGQVYDVEPPDVFNQQIRDAGGDTFAIGPTDTGDQKRVKVGHFLLHAHFLERRIAQSVAWHAEACDGATRSALARVQEDEERHVAYTGTWAKMLLTDAEYAESRTLHERAEAIANLRFSARQCRTWVDRFGKGRGRRSLYAVCAWYMERMAG